MDFSSRDLETSRFHYRKYIKHDRIRSQPFWNSREFYWVYVSLHSLVKVEKANAILNYYRLRNVMKLFHFAKLFFVLILFFWIFTRLPFTIQISRASGGYVGQTDDMCNKHCPPLGNSSFTQEGYFEITILFSGEGDPEAVGQVKEGERTKLVHENSNAKTNSEFIIHLEERKLGSKDDNKGEVVMLSMRLTIGGSLPLKLPSSFPGSIGLNSNGFVYLDRIKLVFE
ncbi:hypothetical protein AAG906_018863 [Vitis piasezkii]